MKFPKITSAPLTQLPTDSSELTPQENYIFEKIFQPEIQMFMSEQSKQMAQKNVEGFSNSKEDTQRKTEDKKSIFKKMTIAFIFTAILILFSMSPMPSMISSSMTSSKNLFFIISLSIFIVSFIFIPKLIK